MSKAIELKDERLCSLLQPLFDLQGTLKEKYSDAEILRVIAPKTKAIADVVNDLLDDSERLRWIGRHYPHIVHQYGDARSGTIRLALSIPPNGCGQFTSWHKETDYYPALVELWKLEREK